MIIYKTTNIINGKIYIGQTANNNETYLGSGVKIYEAIRKYGKENFKREVIDRASCLSELAEKEKHWIKFYDSQNPMIGYNIAFGGQGIGNFGLVRSEKTRKLMSESKQGEKNNMYGQGHKISGEKNGQYGMTGEKSPNFGKQHKPETIALMKEKARKGPRSDDEKKKMSEGIKRNMKYFIRQIDRNTGEIIEDHLTVKDASIKTEIKYHKVYSNLDENFMFTRVYKTNTNN